MEKIVDDWLGQFEHGRISRRQLVQMLALGMTAAAATVIRKVLARALEDVMEHRRLGATDASSAARPPSPPRIPPAA